MRRFKRDLYRPLREGSPWDPLDFVMIFFIYIFHFFKEIKNGHVIVIIIIHEPLRVKEERKPVRLEVSAQGY